MWDWIGRLYFCVSFFKLVRVLLVYDGMKWGVIIGSGVSGLFYFSNFRVWMKCLVLVIVFLLF